MINRRRTCKQEAQTPSRDQEIPARGQGEVLIMGALLRLVNIFRLLHL